MTSSNMSAVVSWQRRTNNTASAWWGGRVCVLDLFSSDRHTNMDTMRRQILLTVILVGLLASIAMALPSSHDDDQGLGSLATMVNSDATVVSSGTLLGNLDRLVTNVEAKEEEEMFEMEDEYEDFMEPFLDQEEEESSPSQVERVESLNQIVLGRPKSKPAVADDIAELVEFGVEEYDVYDELDDPVAMEEDYELDDVAEYSIDDDRDTFSNDDDTDTVDTATTAPLPPANWLKLTSDKFDVRVDMANGAGLGWLSTPGSPLNLINTWDVGRWIQQSYYGRKDGSWWGQQPWRYNPVQLGSWQNYPSQIKYIRPYTTSQGYHAVESAVFPRHWATQQLLTELTMTSRVVLQPNWVQLQNLMTYTGPDVHPVYNQELPAVFLHRRLARLVYYGGKAPWTRDGALTVAYPPAPSANTGNYRNVFTEPWVAYIDPSTGHGIGIYSPKATKFTAYRVGPDVGQPGSRPLSDCSYVAPIGDFAIKPGTYTYDVYIILGTVEDIREVVYQIAGKRW